MLFPVIQVEMVLMERVWLSVIDARCDRDFLGISGTPKEDMVNVFKKLITDIIEGINVHVQFVKVQLSFKPIMVHKPY